MLRDSPRRPGLTLATVCVPMFLVLLDVLVVNIAMPSVGAALHVSRGEWSGLVDAYTLPLAVGLLPGGCITDRVGPRRTLAAGTIVFGLASLSCATADSWSVLLGGRAVQGLGAAAMLPASLAALTGLWREPAARSRALGTWAGLSALATALGPAIGGLLLAVASWRALFWMSLPICVIALVGAVTLLPADIRAIATRHVVRHRPLAGSTLAGGLMTVVGNGTLTAGTLELRGAAHLRPLPAAGVLLIGTIPFAALGPVAGRLIGRWGRRRTATAGLLTGVVGFVAALLVGGVAPPARVPVMLLALGVALGLMTAPIVGEAMAALPGRQGLAAGLNNTARQIGTSAGVAAATAVVAATPAGRGVVWVLVAGAVIWAATVAVTTVAFDR